MHNSEASSELTAQCLSLDGEGLSVPTVAKKTFRTGLRRADGDRMEREGRTATAAVVVSSHTLPLDNG